jgi:hypothetical protein
MSRTTAFLTAAGLGAGIMYLFDPRQGLRRRAMIRDKMIRATHQIQEGYDVVAQDMRNRISGLSAGDWTVLIGGKNAIRGNPLCGGWSPSARAIMGLIGGGLFLFGLTRKTPTACILGTAGLALIAEGASNAGIEEIKSLPTNMARKTAEVSQQVLENFDHPVPKESFFSMAATHK